MCTSAPPLRRHNISEAICRLHLSERSEFIRLWPGILRPLWSPHSLKRIRKGLVVLLDKILSLKSRYKRNSKAKVSFADASANRSATLQQVCTKIAVEGSYRRSLSKIWPPESPSKGLFCLRMSSRSVKFVNDATKYSHLTWGFTLFELTTNAALSSRKKKELRKRCLMWYINEVWGEHVYISWTTTACTKMAARGGDALNYAARSKMAARGGHQRKLGVTEQTGLQFRIKLVDSSKASRPVEREGINDSTG